MLAAISYDPLLRIEIGPLSVSPHGIGIALGFLIGARFMLPTAKAKGINEEDIYPLLTLAAIGAIVGARVAYVVNHPGDYNSVLDVFKVWQGGISLLGGIIGAIVFAMPSMKKRGISFWKIMDASAPGLALGIVIGRIGDLIVGDHLGKPTDLFFGYRCPPLDVDTASPCDPGVVVHQTALYDLLIAFGLFLFLLWLSRAPRREGVLILTFGIWYGAGRILTDFLRVDKTWFGLTGSQWTSVAVIVLSLLVLMRFWRRPIVPPAGEDIDPESRDAAAGEIEPVARPTTHFVPPAEPDTSA